MSQSKLPSQPLLPKTMYLNENHASKKTGITVKAGEQVTTVARKGDWAVTKTSEGKIIWIPLTKLSPDKPAELVRSTPTSFQNSIVQPENLVHSRPSGTRTPEENWLGEKSSLSFDEVFQEPIRLGWVREASMVLESSEPDGLLQRIAQRNGSITLSGISNSIMQDEQRFFICEKQDGIEKHFIPIGVRDLKVGGTPDNIELVYDARNRYDQEFIALITGWLRFFNAREKQEHRLGVSMVSWRPVGIERSRKPEGDRLLSRYEIRMKDGNSKAFYCILPPKLPSER